MGYRLFKLGSAAQKNGARSVEILASSSRQGKLILIVEGRKEKEESWLFEPADLFLI